MVHLVVKLSLGVQTRTVFWLCRVFCESRALQCGYVISPLWVCCVTHWCQCSGVNSAQTGLGSVGGSAILGNDWSDCLWLNVEKCNLSLQYKALKSHWKPLRPLRKCCFLLPCEEETHSAIFSLLRREMFWKTTCNPCNWIIWKHVMLPKGACFVFWYICLLSS